MLRLSKSRRPSSCAAHLRPGTRVRFLERDVSRKWSFLGTVIDSPAGYAGPDLVLVRFDARRLDDAGLEHAITPSDLYRRRADLACFPTCAISSAAPAAQDAADGGAEAPA